MRRSESARFRFRPPSGDAAPRNDTLRILIVLSDDDSLKSESIADMLPALSENAGLISERFITKSISI